MNNIRSHAQESFATCVMLDDGEYAVEIANRQSEHRIIVRIVADQYEGKVLSISLSTKEHPHVSSVTGMLQEPLIRCYDSLFHPSEENLVTLKKALHPLLSRFEAALEHHERD